MKPRSFAKTQIKLLLWLVLLALLAGGVGMAFRGITTLLEYFHEGADPAEALHLVPNVPPDLHVALHWLDDDTDTGRALEANTRSDVAAAYLRAWLQWNISYARDEPYGLKTYFVGPAQRAISETIQAATTGGWHIEQTDTVHNLKLHLYSADGSILSFTDSGVRVTQIVHDRHGAVALTDESVATYDVVMFLADGNWRVRYWVRSAVTEETPALPPAVPLPGFVARSGAALTLDGQPYQVNGINYYPARTAWDLFWPHYDPTVVDKDFATMQALGLNTVRIFVPFTGFGGAEVQPAMLDRLADLLGHAQAHGCKVIVTLFDFHSDYSLFLWPPADRHLETILHRFADNPTILAWDLKNEPDRDYPAAGRAQVDAWLAHIAHLARQIDPHHLLTIGWSTPAAAQGLAGVSDLVSFHYYAPAAALPAAYTTLRAAVGDQPLLLGEFGLPTWNSFLFPNGHSEPEQAEYYADILRFLHTTDSAGSLAWTLYDFQQVPAMVAGRWPWQTGPQGAMGVLHADGTPKPAAALLRTGAALTAPHIPSWSRFLKPFWFTVLAALAALGALGLRLHRYNPVAHWRRRRARRFPWRSR